MGPKPDTLSVLTNYRDRGKCPRFVPWSFVEKFRKQAESNHRQTLEVLESRGGLDPTEMYLAAHGKDLFRHGLDEPALLTISFAWLNEAMGYVP
jgi:hypothetical protein